MVAPTLASPGASRLVSSIWTAVRAREAAITLLLIATVFSAVQSATPSIIGIDGYYHIKVAELMREYGPRLDFPWLQLTILGPGQYADHHFLFHVLQVPFTLGDIRTGAKMAAVLFATTGIFVSYLLLARNNVRYPVLWVLIMLAASQTFLWRQSMARPQGLFLALLVLGVWAAFGSRWPLFLPIGVAAAWLFDGFPLLLAVPLSGVGAVALLWLISRPSETLREQWHRHARDAWQPAVLACIAASAGIMLGLATHPYFPRHLEFAMLHLLPKAQVGIELDVRVGGEWYPFPLERFPSRLGVSIALCALGLVPLGWQLWRRQLPDWRGVALAGLALGLLGMTIRSQRIIEYLPPFAAIFCAWTWTHHGGAALLERLPRARLVQRWLMVLVCLLVLGGLGWNVNQARREAAASHRWDLPRAAAEWLEANTPPGARVFTPVFDDFPRLFFWNTHNTYLVGLDPTYMTLYDPELFTLWRRIGQGREPQPAQLIKERFGADYVYTDRSRTAFVRAVQNDPGLEVVHTTSRTLVLRVRPSS